MELDVLEPLLHIEAWAGLLDPGEVSVVDNLGFGAGVRFFYASSAIVCAVLHRPAESFSSKPLAISDFNRKFAAEFIFNG